MTRPLAHGRAIQLDRLSGRQHGLVTSAQMERLGYNSGARKYLCATGRIIRVRKGVYRLCGVAPTWRSTALAAVLAASTTAANAAAAAASSTAAASSATVANAAAAASSATAANAAADASSAAAATRDRRGQYPAAVLSHHSAGVLWGLIEEHHQAGPLHVTSPCQGRMTGVTIHRHRLVPGDCAVRDRIPVTSIERTLVDLAESVPAQALGRMLDEAARRRLTTPDRVAVYVRTLERAGRKRLAAMREALADRGVDYDPGANDWERDMDRMWDRMALPQAERQFTIVVAGGRKYRPDRAIVAERIAIDWNGYGTHGLRSGFEHDIERRNHLLAAGWTPLEFHSNQSPEQICRTVLQVYERRRAASLPAS